MITSFKDPETEKIFNGYYSRILPREIQDTAKRKLIALNGTISLQDISRIHGNHFEKLIGNREGQYSIRINDKYRICFQWNGKNIYDVEIVDYH